MDWKNTSIWKELLEHLRGESVSVGDVDSFERWARTVLRPAFPHEWLIVAIGNKHEVGSFPTNYLAVDFPLTYIERIKNLQGGVESPVLKRWFASQKPVSYEVGVSQWPEANPRWLANLQAFGVRNVVAHGQLYPETRRFAYVNLVQIPGKIEDLHLRFLERLTPLICTAAWKAVSTLPKSDSGDRPVLSERETQVIGLVARGLSDKAIARELSIADTSVRTLLKRAALKLGTKNRAETVRYAMPILSQYPPVSELANFDSTPGV